MSILLIGCGHSKAIRKPSEGVDYSTPVTLDIDETCEPDVVWDLHMMPYPFPDNKFDEIHAYEVLEHCGRQGDWRFFFAQFNEFYRMLKPDGLFIFSVPQPYSVWAWGDPGHSRIIHPCNIVFLNQDEYRTQVGKGTMTDYRSVYHGDFVAQYNDIVDDSFVAVLKARK